MPEQGAQPPEDDPSSSSDRHSPVPSPDDRLWRHPAEVAAAQRSNTAVATTRSRLGSTMAVAAVTVIGGGLLITGLWLVMDSTASTPVASAGGRFAAVLDRPEPEVAVAQRIELSTVELHSIKGADLGTALALHNGDEVVASVDLAPGTRLAATLPDGSTRPATVVGHDALTGVTAVQLDSGTVAGALLDLDHRRIDATSDTLVTNERRNGWSHATLEIDDPNVQPGDAVLDDGAVTAMVSWITHNGAAATPIAVVDRVARQLFAGGVAAHPWLGIEGIDARAAGGVVVTAVVPGGPAQRHEITRGMRITGLGDTSINSMAGLLTELRTHQPGDTVTIEVRDDEATRRIVLDVGDTADAPV